MVLPVLPLSVSRVCAASEFRRRLEIGLVEFRIRRTLVLLILRLYRELVHLDRHVLLAEAEEAADADLAAWILPSRPTITS